ncbi:1,4-beta-xylanase [Cohnella sp. CFH 77786]|uniref:endo-1,4-beta-xylanase n=1 Tax=Cohnella sp. CFH 77786 TaxID=2662265 RepID=UPI001C60DAB7|nr:endo-1,4-beta-xylanase [Cohnella sp. CFH 77786]MBW5445731.1 1,4-beta-xylanase [Cohnella sp. CFH 77786]
MKLGKRVKKGWMCLLAFGMLLPFVAPERQAAAADTAVVSDFEDGTAQGWFGRGDTVSVVAGGAHGGTYSLKSTGRTQSWMGPGFNATFLASRSGAYDFSAWVKLEDGHPDAVVNVTLESQVAGSQTHDYSALVHGTTVKAGEWTEIKGTYTLPPNLDYVQIYFESPDASLSFSIDDVSFAPQLTPPGDTDFANDFEDGTTQGWQPRIGPESVTVTADAAHGGTHSLKVANRDGAFYMGASKDVTGLLNVGSTYRFTAWAKLVSAAGSETIKMTMQTSKGASENYQGISFESVTAGQWVRIEGDYAYSALVDKLSLYFESEHAGIDFYVDDVSMTKLAEEPPIEIQKDIPSLKDVFADDFLIGTAFTNDELDDGPNEELMAKHFNSVTPGNIIKWDSTEPREGEFRLEGADEAVQFALDNGIQVRGHTLVWHSQTPNWVFYDDSGQLVSKDVLFARMERHIKTVVGHFKGKMYAWDVVNEVIDASQPDGLRRSPWYQIAGEAYIDKAFQFAREADPDAKLFINDYGTENPVKAQALYDLVKRLKARGVPVDGVGHQFHISIQSPPVGNLDQAILKFADLGVQQQVTEMDMSVYTNDGQRYDTFTKEMELEQAYRYQAIFEILKKRKNLVNSVTLWGKDDGHTWLTSFPVIRNNWPLLFDKRLQAKYAYWAIVDPSKIPVLMQKADSHRGAAKVDGKSELAWDVLKPVAITDGGGGLQAEFKTMWDDRYLYVWADVTDASEDRSDTVTVYVKQGSAAAGSYPLTRKESRAADVDYKTKEREGGYRVEARIPWAEAAAAGSQVRFDLRVVDASGIGAVISWNDRTNAEPPVPDNWGALTLRDPMKVADAARGTPVIGSFDEAAWSRAKELVTGTQVQGTGGATAKVKVMWDAGHLYVSAKVTDPVLSDKSPNVWEQDSVEIFLDPDNHKSDSYEEGDGQYRVNFNNAVSFGDTTPREGFVSRVKLTADGYWVEASIPVSGIAMQKDTLIGFDLQVNDDGTGGGSRTSVMTWSDPTGQAYMNPSTFGVVRLVKH